MCARRILQMGLTAMLPCILLVGCTTDQNYVRRNRRVYLVRHSVDPYAGREWQQGMRALGAVLRPYSKLTPVETEKRIGALEGLGTFMDLMNR